jgi:UDP-N-acetylmuramate--alanine ligase
MKEMIYMVGIKGVGMAALAAFFSARGHLVRGSDGAEQFPTEKMLRKFKITVKRFGKRIPLRASRVIYSTAYDPFTHLELRDARKRGITIQSYTEALAEVFNNFPHRILVTGTHGKTTTTAMIGHILERAGYDPTVLVGGYVSAWGGNARISEHLPAAWIVAEGDEYQAKILHMNPTLLVCTRVDYDHPDFFPTKAAYQRLFEKVIGRLPPERVIRANTSEKKLQFDLSVFGPHNQENAETAFRAARAAGISSRAALEALKTFSGVERRLEYHSDPEAPLVLLDDYAHHPVEIRAALEAVRERYPARHRTVVFQPHTFSRTEAFLEDFARSFGNADSLIVLETYASARESSGRVGARELADAAKKYHPHVAYAATHDDAAVLAKKFAHTREAVFLTMGAGDVARIMPLIKA